MQLVRRIADVTGCRGGVVSIGNFDGVHLGHARIVSRLVSRARCSSQPAEGVTFDPHPIQLLRTGAAPPLLSTIEDRARCLGGMGVDVVVAYPTTVEMLRLTPVEFFREVIMGQLGASGMVEGPNFFFGRDRQGDVGVLSQFCDADGIGLDVVGPEMVDGEMVSSSRIRSLLADGNVGAAAASIGRPYAVSGMVVSGEGRGRKLGVPTANLSEILTLVPGDGVYVGATEVEGMRQPAAIHVGSNPTFGESANKIEVHLLAFDGDLYGRDLTVQFLERVRGTVEFETVDALREQLADDIEAVWQYVEAHPAANIETGGVDNSGLS